MPTTSVAQLLYPRDLRSSSAFRSGAAAKYSSNVDPATPGSADEQSLTPNLKADPQAIADSGSTDPPPEIARPLVLVVDDEEMILTVASQILIRRGFEVLVARDGAEGLRVFVEHCDQIDLVLLDLNMPGRGGYETLREMRKIKLNARVILTSGFGEQESTDLLDASQPVDFLQKPYRVQALVAKVRQALGRVDNLD